MHAQVLPDGVLSNEVAPKEVLPESHQAVASPDQTDKFAGPVCRQLRCRLGGRFIQPGGKNHLSSEMFATGIGQKWRWRRSRRGAGRVLLEAAGCYAWNHRCGGTYRPHGLCLGVAGSKRMGRQAAAHLPPASILRCLFSPAEHGDAYRAALFARPVEHESLGKGRAPSALRLRSFPGRIRRARERFGSRVVSLWRTGAHDLHRGLETP